MSEIVNHERVKRYVELVREGKDAEAGELLNELNAEAHERLSTLTAEQEEQQLRADDLKTPAPSISFSKVYRDLLLLYRDAQQLSKWASKLKKAMREAKKVREARP